MVANRITTLIDFQTGKASSSLAGIRKQMAEATTLSGKFKAGWSGAMNALGSSTEAQIGIVGAGAGMMVKSIQAASDLNESINAVNVAYGENADAVLKLGEDSATAFGLSQNAFNGLAVQFSSFAKKVGAGTGQSPAAVVEDLTTRVADFASVMNLDVNEAATVFMSTLSGETEPIRRFGKDVSAAAVEQYALAKGLITSKSELTETIKVQARYGLLMDQTADTAGDFKNTQDSLANSTRVLKAQFEDLKATVGNEFLPMVAETTSTVSKLAGMFEKLRSSSIGASKPVRDLFTIMEMGINPIKFVNWHINEFKTRVNAVFGPAKSLNENLVEQAEAALNLGEAYSNLTPKVEGYDGASGRAATRMAQLEGVTGDVTRAQNIVADAISNATDAAEAQKIAVKELRDEHRAAADQLYDLHDAELAYDEAVQSATDALADEDTSLKEARQSIEGVAQAADEMASQMVTNQGISLDSVAGQKAWTQAMLETANTLSGPMREEVLNHIARVTGIPREVITDIAANLDDRSYEDVERELEYLTRQRFARIDVTTGGVAKYAKGTNFHPGGLAIVGEQGPELVNLPRGSSVETASQTRSVMRSGTGGGGGNTYILQAMVPNAETLRTFGEWVDAHERKQRGKR